MFPNHYVYKGYRLSANVQRVLSGDPGAGLEGVTFRASIVVARAADSDEPGIEYEVPAFEQNGGMHSPREAIHAAIEHGCKLVDAMSSPSLAH
ncbi:hypothetical protein V8Z80_08155 [Orrella sp. JC864]|uniref:hypothetical protein n=1 Tax=Orrella sp. JC864 TaxID=3120298 RepID=UPI0012BC5F59